MKRIKAFSRYFGFVALMLTIVPAGNLALAGSSCSAGHTAPDLVETAIEAGSFKTLIAAAKAAGLVGALKGDGPLTVFAPTDAAFAKLPKGTVESLLEPQNKDRLAAILTYHVAPGNFSAERVVAMDRIKTLNGQRPSVVVKGSEVFLDGARVTATDIKAANGVIHVIDSVLLPSDKDIIDTALEAGSFKTLAAALDAADLVGALRGEGPFTVFAPTDEAFARLPEGTVEDLLKPENRDQLTAILTYHVVSGDVYSSDARPGRVETLQGSEVSISENKGNLRVNQANVISTDIATTNGVIHVIDEVILPEQRASAAMHPARELIRMAIDRGAPLFNRSQPEACTAIYEIAARSLLSSDSFGLSGQERATLEKAMWRVGRTHDAREQAWIMRDALDHVMDSMSRMDMS